MDCFFSDGIPLSSDKGSPNNEQQELAKGKKYLVSKYIGYLERALIITLVLNDSIQAVAFVITVKSIARYKEIEEKDFAQYYLLGTLTSTLLAVLGGLFLKKFLS